MMFTGIIEEVGTLQTIRRQSKTLQLKINAKLILSDINIGDSIAVNGVCLTVTSFDKSGFMADVMPVTFESTNLKQLKSGSFVNLERAMAANGRFGGHIVSGHVDAIGIILARNKAENAVIYQIKIPSELKQFCIAKGSIALDGTSLTLVEVTNDWVSVSLIPHTQEKSLLGAKGMGDLVNIECDILAKQIIAGSLATLKPAESKLTFAFLQEHGFL